MTELSVWLGIAIGGALGALGRAAFLRAADALAFHRGISATTAAQSALLFANTLGCLAIGLIVGTDAHLPEWLFLTLAVGFCGALTTFSTLCALLVQQLRETQGLRRAAIQLVLNLVLGYAALSIGLSAGA